MKTKQEGGIVMKTTARFHWAFFIVAFALFGLSWGADDAHASSNSRAFTPKTEAMFLDLD